MAFDVASVDCSVHELRLGRSTEVGRSLVRLWKCVFETFFVNILLFLICLRGLVFSVCVVRVIRVVKW